MLELSDHGTNREMHLGQKVPAHTNDATETKELTSRVNAPKRRQLRHRQVKCHEMLWMWMPSARQTGADVCSGESRKQWGCMKLLRKEPRCQWAGGWRAGPTRLKGRVNSHFLGRLTVLGGRIGKHKPDVADLPFTLAAASSHTSLPSWTNCRDESPPGMILSPFNSTRPLKAACCRELSSNHVTNLVPPPTPARESVANRADARPPRG